MSDKPTTNSEKDEELAVLGEVDFLAFGEQDPEMEYILHFDQRVFDYIAKDIGLAADVEQFCLRRNYFPIQETAEKDGKEVIIGVYVDTEDELYCDIVASMVNEMEARKNPNV